jgi:hypothetical protein
MMMMMMMMMVVVMNRRGQTFRELALRPFSGDWLY